MGTTGILTDQTAHQYVTEQMAAEPRVRRIVASSGGVYAIEHVDGHVYGLVVISERRDGWLYIKYVDEDMGPNELAPKRVLDKLTHTDNEYAIEWRKRSRKVADMPKLKAGDILDLKHPLDYGTYGSFMVFKLTERRNTAITMTGLTVRLPTYWKKLERA